jgi:hypothetical protein
MVFAGREEWEAVNQGSRRDAGFEQMGGGFQGMLFSQKKGMRHTGRRKGG